MGIENRTPARHFHYPHLVINPGEIKSIADGQALQANLPPVAPQVSTVEAIQVGSTGANVTFRANVGERLVEGVCMVKIDASHWGIKASSLIIC